MELALGLVSEKKLAFLDSSKDVIDKRLRAEVMQFACTVGKHRSTIYPPTNAGYHRKRSGADREGK